MSGLGGKVAIIGTGTIKFGENFHQSLSDIIFEAVNLAMADAKIESRQLQAAWFGCYEPMLYGFECNSGTFVSDPLNLFPIPVTRVAAYCATGIEAVRNASLAVASGEYDLVPRDQRQPARSKVALDHVDVRPACAAGSHAHSHFSRTRLGHGQIGRRERRCLDARLRGQHHGAHAQDSPTE